MSDAQDDAAARLLALHRAAPIDDEPDRDDDPNGLAEARAQIRRGETLSLAQVRRELAEG